jgi:hypothetical protein
MDSDLMPLSGLSQAELRMLADAAVASARQATFHEFLEKNQRGELSSAEEATPDRLLEEIDRMILFKARARYTLNLMEASSETPG